MGDNMDRLELERQQGKYWEERQTDIEVDRHLEEVHMTIEELKETLSFWKSIKVNVWMDGKWVMFK